MGSEWTGARCRIMVVGRLLCSRKTRAEEEECLFEASLILITQACRR